LWGTGAKRLLLWLFHGFCGGFFLKSMAGVLHPRHQPTRTSGLELASSLRLLTFVWFSLSGFKTGRETLSHSSERWSSFFFNNKREILF
jgi:hypothetical protein